MTFYRSSSRTSLQERLDSERVETSSEVELQSPTDTDLDEGLALAAATKPAPMSTFEVDMLDAWAQP